MSKVEFSDEEISTLPSTNYESSSKMVKLVIKYSGGLIKNETQANSFLIGVVVVSLIVIFFTVINSFEKTTRPPVGLRGDTLEPITN